MALYLLHFHAPISDRHTTQHYLGFADGELEDVLERLAAHAQGRGARLTEVAYERHIPFTLARVWLGKGAVRTFERRLKNQKQGPRLCPLCNPGNSRAQDGEVAVLDGAELAQALEGAELAAELFRSIRRVDADLPF